MKPLPAAYRWIDAVEGAPLMITAARMLYGTIEGPGDMDNPTIVGWAKEIADAAPSAYANWAVDFFNRDAIPWCGVAAAIFAVRAGKTPPSGYLAALSWAAFGRAVRLADAALGDVLVFTRSGGGHVGLYVGEDDTAFHVIGGNQSDAVTIKRIEKSRLYAVRRPAWKRAQPLGVVKHHLAANGQLSRNEA